MVGSASQLAVPAGTTGAHDRMHAGLLAVLAATGSVVFIEPAPYDILAVLMFLGLLATGLRFPRLIQAPLVLLALFVIGNLLAAVLAPDPLESIRSLSIRFYMVVTWLLIVCLIAVQPGRRLGALWAGYMVAAGIAVIWGCLEYFGFLPGELWQGGLRARGAFKDPNVFGPFLVPAAIYSVRRIAGGRGGDALLFGPLFIAIAVSVLLSFSRGAWINFTIALLLYAVFDYWAATPGLGRRLNWLLASAAGVVIIAAALMAAISVEVVGERFYERAVLTQKYDVAPGGRFASQLAALEEIGRNPIGVGPGRTDEEFGEEPHNLYLHVFVEGGWLGGIGFLAFLTLTLRHLLPLVRRRDELQEDVFLVTACLTGLLLQSLFIDSTHWRHMWLLLAVAWGLIVWQRRRATQPRNRFLCSMAGTSSQRGNKLPAHWFGNTGKPGRPA